jgi:hypothetical protein
MRATQHYPTLLKNTHNKKTFKNKLPNIKNIVDKIK